MVTWDCYLRGRCRGNRTLRDGWLCPIYAGRALFEVHLRRPRNRIQCRGSVGWFYHGVRFYHTSIFPRFSSVHHLDKLGALQEARSRLDHYDHLGLCRILLRVWGVFRREDTHQVASFRHHSARGHDVNARERERDDIRAMAGDNCPHGQRSHSHLHILWYGFRAASCLPKISHPSPRQFSFFCFCTRLTIP